MRASSGGAFKARISCAPQFFLLPLVFRFYHSFNSVHARIRLTYTSDYSPVFLCACACVCVCVCVCVVSVIALFVWQKRSSHTQNNQKKRKKTFFFEPIGLDFFSLPSIAISRLFSLFFTFGRILYLLFVCALFFFAFYYILFPLICFVTFCFSLIRESESVSLSQAVTFFS